MAFQISAGEVALVDRFGIVSDDLMGPGLHMVAPFGKVVRFNTRTQTCIEEVDVPTKEGAVLHLEVPHKPLYPHMTLLFLLPVPNVTIGGSIVSCGSLCGTQGISRTGSAISRGCAAAPDSLYSARSDSRTRGKSSV